ncbi:hypothetical protein RDABS01_024703 [Bienertia sinuspersici]
MVEISETPNTERIQDQIAEQLQVSLGGEHSVGHRADRLYNRLTQTNKTLIILDNIWEKLDLRKVGIPQPQENQQEFCCKLLLTSREKNVCEIMGASVANIMEMHTLDDKEARQLFRARVGDKGQDENIEKRMLKKCGGLPLSIVALADLLRDQELSMWEEYAIDLQKQFSTSHGAIVGDVNRLTYSILETSYKHIQSEDQRKFFMLASLFPFGSSIPVDDMMRYGIGLGLFQHVNNLTEAMKQAKKWADTLKSSSLLLEDEREGHVKIHDVVRASTISLAEKGGDVFMVEAFPRWMKNTTCQKYTAISLMAGNDHSRLISSELNFDKLRMLILNGTQPRVIDDTLFQSKMMNLEVLVIKGIRCECLPESIDQNLKSCLTTLHLVNCDLGDIGWIGELASLFDLSLSGSIVKELPKAMRKLCRLCVLDLRGCKISTGGIRAKVLLACLNWKDFMHLMLSKSGLVAYIKVKLRKEVCLWIIVLVMYISMQVLMS